MKKIMNNPNMTRTSLNALTILMMTIPTERIKRNHLMKPIIAMVEDTAMRATPTLIR